MERYVFISYSTQNTEIAFRIKEYLEHKGYPVWIAPTDIPVGERYCNVIEKSIRNCRCFVLLITPSILRSQWIDKEIERAIHYRKPVLGVVLEPAELNDELRFLLSNTQISDCVRSIDDGDPALQSVLRSLAFLFEEGERQAKPLAVDEFSAVRSERNMGKAQLIATAKGLIEGFLASPQRAVEILSRLHFKEVNTYLRLLWEEVSAEEKRTIERNLIAAYRRVRLDPDVTGRREYAVKGQLIYYLTRFCAPTAEGELTDTLKAFYEGEDNVWQRQSLAYGLASAGEFEVPCDYAQKVFAGRDEDVVNRSWTLIFFGDVRDRDPYLYLDDGTAGWNKAREARLSRLKRNDPKAMAYRALDLAVLFAFYRSRNWSDFDAVDYEVIRKAEVSSPEMPKSVKKFNKFMQKELTDRLKAVRDTAQDADDRLGCT